MNNSIEITNPNYDPNANNGGNIYMAGGILLTVLILIVAAVGTLRD